MRKLVFYIRSLDYGHKYIWQSLPRALDIWFNDYPEASGIMKNKLIALESFKIASVLQILLSRFGHPNEKVRDAIIEVLAKLASEYPSQSSWWINHFEFFEYASSRGIN